jgi:heme oxygenase
MQPGLDQTAYGWSLFCLYQAWAPAEWMIERIMKEHAANPAFAQLACYHFPRRQALKADLAELTWPLPRCGGRQPAEGNVSPLASLAGQLYVLAGGQLGSVLIERKLGTVNPGLPMRFFQTRPADLGQRWAGFRECLDTLFALPEAHEPVIEAANLAFHHFIERLETAARSAPASAP